MRLMGFMFGPSLPEGPPPATSHPALGCRASCSHPQRTSAPPRAQQHWPPVPAPAPAGRAGLTAEEGREAEGAGAATAGTAGSGSESAGRPGGSLRDSTSGEASGAAAGEKKAAGLKKRGVREKAPAGLKMLPPPAPAPGAPAPLPPPLSSSRGRQQAGSSGLCSAALSGGENWPCSRQSGAAGGVVLCARRRVYVRHARQLDGGDMEVEQRASNMLEHTASERKQRKRETLHAVLEGAKP